VRITFLSGQIVSAMGVVALGAAGAVAAPKHAIPPRPAVKPAAKTALPAVVGFPQDAGPHDRTSAIEWWYFNSFLTTERRHHYAIMGAFFRTGLSASAKGHYLIYALADLDAKTRTPYSVLDPAEIDLLKTYTAISSARRPDDPKPIQLLNILQRGELPPPHRISDADALVKTKPTFSIAFDNALLVQTGPSGLAWRTNLNGDDWTLDLALRQPSRPAMRVGGTGRTGLHRPDDMYYVSLTRMHAQGTLTIGGVVDKVVGTGWLDRQWGTSWGVGDNGWDWFGLQLDDGSDLIVYRVRDNVTGKILRAEATLLAADGVETVDSAPVLTPTLLSTPTAATVGPGASETVYVDPATHIPFPQEWTITLPKIGLTLTTASAFPDQTMPVVGIGDAIWEGVVTATGMRAGRVVKGRGYMELVGYKPLPTPTDNAAPTP
jgi:predicted secreted hydrolase